MTEQYIVNSEEELDAFDYQAAYWKHGEDYVVFHAEEGVEYKPVYCYRENGDMDGLMGWN